MITGGLGTGGLHPVYVSPPPLFVLEHGATHSPAVAKPLSGLNDGKNYCDQIKPFNFLLACQVKQLGHPLGVDPERFHLIRPYDLDPRKWLKENWIDQYSGSRYSVITTGHHGSRRAARVKTYGDVLQEYEYHPEAK